MRDIRNDLRERLGSITGQYADEMVSFEQKRAKLFDEHKSVLEALDRERSVVQSMLDFEDQRAGLDGDIKISIDRQNVDLGQFILAKIRNYGPIDKDSLRKDATDAGYFSEGTTGRTFHTVLMNLTKYGKIHKTEDGQFLIPPRSAFEIFGEPSEDVFN
jgi:hypothetical protein